MVLWLQALWRGTGTPGTVPLMALKTGVCEHSDLRGLAGTAGPGGDVLRAQGTLGTVQTRSLTTCGCAGLSGRFPRRPGPWAVSGLGFTIACPEQWVLICRGLGWAGCLSAVRAPSCGALCLPLELELSSATVKTTPVLFIMGLQQGDQCLGQRGRQTVLK